MSAEWYYQRNGQREGPITLEELRALLRSGQVGANELVWGPSLKDWQPASQVELLAGSAGVSAAAAHAPPVASPAPPVAAARYAQAGVLDYSMPQVESLTFTPRAMDMLRQTKPWARLIAVLIFVGAAFMILAGLAMMAGMFALGGRGGGPPALLGLVYIAMSCLYLAPAMYLNRYASRIGELMHLNRADVLERALEAQKSFWKFAGIMAAIIIAIYIVIIAIVILVSVLA